MNDNAGPDNMLPTEDDIIIHPAKGKRDKEVPPIGIFFVTPAEAGNAIRAVLQNGGERRFLHNSNLAVSADGSRFVAGPAVGAPAAALVMEKLIVLGAQHIILMGWCGAVAPSCVIGDIIVPDKAVSGEGTSRYYGIDDTVQPCRQGNIRLQKLLKNEKLQYKEGTIWSTDAPYRESREMLHRLQKRHQVVAVDMEFSALCSVAAFRSVGFGAVLLVSDEVWGPCWKPGFKDSRFVERRERIMECLLLKELW